MYLRIAYSYCRLLTCQCVVISAPVANVVISDDNKLDRVTTSPPIINLVENRPSTLRCAAFGGYPLPSVEIRLGLRDLTSHFQYSNNATMTGRRGLRHVTYRSDLWTYDFKPSAEDDQTSLKCVATVPGLQPYIGTVQLSIDCKYDAVYI
jgi:CD80-like C2-set immunoglobulin domain